MLHEAPSLLAAFALGLSLAAPPGPINILILNEAISRSWLSGASVGLGAATADFAFYTLISILGVKILAFWIIRPLLYAAGSIILLYLAFTLITRSSSGSRLEQATSNVSGVGYLKGLSIGLTNPLQIGWWLAVGIALVSLFGYYFAFGFFSGILCWVLVFSYVASLFRFRLLRVFRVVSLVSAAVLLGFMALFTYRLLVLVEPHIIAAHLFCNNMNGI
ncbi:MAG: LysE family transporter [Thermoprotei archaeon]